MRRDGLVDTCGLTFEVQIERSAYAGLEVVSGLCSRPAVTVSFLRAATLASSS